ncbi:MAG: hypothetical protein IKW91_06680, partial [Bacteroidaceae bacterium]|nr:hypothetical protein [Bacteroidaceae bacterium]
MKKKCEHSHEMNRRQFLERLGLGSATAISLITIGSLSNSPLKAEGKNSSIMGGLDGQEAEEGSMTYRTQNGTGEKISLL